MGGPPRKIRDDAEAYSVSPDGSSIAFGEKNGKFGNREIWLMGPTGERARKLYTADGDSSIFGALWFRDGQRILYLRMDKSGARLESRNLKGGPITKILPYSEMDQAATDRISSFAWSPDGRLIYSLQESDRDNVTSDSIQLLGAAHQSAYGRSARQTVATDELDWIRRECLGLYRRGQASGVSQMD